LIGQTILTQNNIANPRMKPDAIAMGYWVFYQHTVDRQVVDAADGRKVVRNEGKFGEEYSFL
jgi:hypothetical protein